MMSSRTVVTIWEEIFWSCSPDECKTYVSHVGGVQLSAGGSATAAAVCLLQAETVAVQWVNMRVCEDESSSSDKDLKVAHHH